MEERKHFGYGRIAAIGAGFFALSVAWVLYNTFMPIQEQNGRDDYLD